MKVKKQQLNKDLQSTYRVASFMAWLLSRKWGIRVLQSLMGFRKGKKLAGVENDERFIPSGNGDPDIRIRIYRPANIDLATKLPVLLYIHGGGYVIGCPELFGDYIKRFIETRPCIVVSPDYRKAMEAPFPGGFNDCYDTLLWIRDNANELGANTDKFMIGGHSAGGGMTAALTWKARDTGDVNVGFQMPIYPMIDDRHITESARDMVSPLWRTSSNKLAWSLYLGAEATRTPDYPVPDYAAPARNSNYENFPPTFTFVGDLEPFKDETIAYVEALKKAGVPVTFRLFQGCYHGFDGMNAEISKQARDFTFDTYAEYYDQYICQPKHQHFD